MSHACMQHMQRFSSWGRGKQVYGCAVRGYVFFIYRRRSSLAGHVLCFLYAAVDKMETDFAQGLTMRRIKGFIYIRSVR